MTRPIHVEPSTHAPVPAPLHQDKTALTGPTTDPLWKSPNGSSSDDLWSAAFREAVEEIQNHTDISLLEGQNIAQLFEKLEQIDEQAIQEDAFLRGVKYLRSIHVPLENFKLALDLATPLAALEPTTMTVFGVVKSVTAVCPP